MKKKPSAPSRRAAPSAALLGAALRSQAEGVVIAEVRSDPKVPSIIFVNEALAQMTGHSPARLHGRSLRSLHVEQTDMENLARRIPEMQPGQSFIGEGRLIRRDGGTVDVAWSVVALCDKQGRVRHLVATYRDTTEKRRLQEALLHAQRLDAVGRLAGGIAHDFNNLLSIINGYCQILGGRIADQPLALREVQEIHRAGEKAADLTRQLLAFGRRQHLEPRVIDLNLLVRENTNVLSRLLEPAGELVLELDARPTPVRSDPAQLQQVLLNLVINARDALRRNGRVTIRTLAGRFNRPALNRRITDLPPGYYVALTVEDNGIGMDAETQTHLFEPYFTTKAEGRGTGLGLALVYGVVQQSGGFISVKSTVGVGSSFEILLPLASGPAEPVRRPLPPLPEPRGHETILLVEDDEAVANMVGSILDACGYQVLHAARSADAELEHGSTPIHLLIASINSPAGDGAGLAARLKAAHPGLRVLNTGRPGSPAIEGIRRERQQLVPKPYSLSNILLAARRLLDA